MHEMHASAAEAKTVIAPKNAIEKARSVLAMVSSVDRSCSLSRSFPDTHLVRLNASRIWRAMEQQNPLMVALPIGACPAFRFELYSVTRSLRSHRSSTHLASFQMKCPLWVQVTIPSSSTTALELTFQLDHRLRAGHHPLLTQKVIAGIHWEALRLWSKGLKVRSRPSGR